MQTLVRNAALCSLAALTACGSEQGDAANADAGARARAPAKSSWTMLGFDVGSTYHNPYEDQLTVENVKGLTEAWSLRAVGSVTGVPCVLGEHAVVVAQGSVYKVEVATGKVVWQNRKLGGTSSPACDGQHVYLQDGPANVQALDYADGKLQWTAEVDPHEKASGFSSVIIAGDKLLTGASSAEETSVASGATFRGSVVALDKASGDELWRYYTTEEQGSNGATVWSTPSVSLTDQMVFISTGNNYTGEANERSDALIALDLETGEELWVRQLTAGDVFTTLSPNGNPDDDFGANPILFEAEIDGARRKLVGAGQKSGWFWAVDRMNGEIVWSREVSGGSAGTGGVLNNGAFDGKRVLVAGNNSLKTGVATLMALDPASGDVLWERELDDTVWAPITTANGVGFVATGLQLHAFDAATGADLWSMVTKGTIGCGAAISEGRVFFGSGFTYTPQVIRDVTFHALELP